MLMSFHSCWHFFDTLACSNFQERVFLLFKNKNNQCRPRGLKKSFWDTIQYNTISPISPPPHPIPPTHPMLGGGIGLGGGGMGSGGGGYWGYCIVLYCILKAFLETRRRRFFGFAKKHVPGFLDMQKCQKVSKCVKMIKQVSKLMKNYKNDAKFSGYMHGCIRDMVTGLNVNEGMGQGLNLNASTWLFIIVTISTSTSTVEMLGEALE